jgi:hypothetical protein
MTTGDSKGVVGPQPAVIRRVRRALTCAALAAALLGPFGFGVAKADEAMIENCLKAAADLHHVPAGLLVLLINVEAGRLGAVSQNSTAPSISVRCRSMTHGFRRSRAIGARRPMLPIRRCATVFARMSRAAHGSCARRSMRRGEACGRASRSITRMPQSISSNICGSSTRPRCP